MNGVLPAWLARALAAAILLTLMSLAWGLIVAPIWHGFSARFEQISTTREAIAGLRALMTRGDALGATLQTLDAHPIWSRLFDADTNAEAQVAALQNDFRAATQRAGLVIAALQPLEPDTQHDLRRVGIEVQIEGSIEALRDLLREIGGSARFMELDDVIITAPLTQEGDANPLLSVRMHVYGYAVAEAPS